MRAEGTYGSDMAYIHEQGFGWYARQSAPGLLALLRRYGVADGLVVDLGCGNGVWQEQLVFFGYQALGLDASEPMIRLARRTAPGARFEVGDIGRHRLPRCSAVTSLGEVLSYAMQSDRDGASMRALMKRVFASLRPGGVFLFDVGIPGRHPSGMPRSGHWMGEDWAILLTTEEDPSRQVLTRRLTSFRKRGTSYRRSTEVHRLKLFDPATLEQELLATGFAVKRLTGFGRVRFQSGHTGFLAQKPPFVAAFRK